MESIDALYLPGVDPIKESRRLRRELNGKSGRVEAREEQVSLRQVTSKGMHDGT